MCAEQLLLTPVHCRQQLPPGFLADEKTAVLSGLPAVKLAGLLAAYGLQSPLLQFYRAGEDGLLCVQGDIATLCGVTALPPTALPMLGVRRYYADRPLFSLCERQRPVLRRRARAGPAADTAIVCPPLREVAQLLSQVFCGLDVDGLYCDLSHRVRHSKARVLGRYQGGQLVATAGVYTAAPSGCVIEGVAVLPNWRRRGLASALLGALEGQFVGQQLWLCCREERVPFYLKNGYVPAGTIVEGNL